MLFLGLVLLRSTAQSGRFCKFCWRADLAGLGRKWGSENEYLTQLVSFTVVDSVTSGTGVVGYRVAVSLLEAGHKDVRVGIWKGDRQGSSVTDDVAKVRVVFSCCGHPRLSIHAFSPVMCSGLGREGR